VTTASAIARAEVNNIAELVAFAREHVGNYIEGELNGWRVVVHFTSVMSFEVYCDSREFSKALGDAIAQIVDDDSDAWMVSHRTTAPTTVMQ
jgi:hypothetical protein